MSQADRREASQTDRTFPRQSTAYFSSPLGEGWRGNPARWNTPHPFPPSVEWEWHNPDNAGVSAL